MEFNEKKVRKYYSGLGFRYFAGGAIVLFVIFGCAFLLKAVKPEWMDSTEGLLLVENIPRFLIGYPILILLIRYKTVKVTIEEHKMSVGKILIAFMMAYSLMILLNIIGTIATFLGNLAIGQDAVNSNVNPVAGLVTNTGIPLQILLMVIVGPIFEELIFRKLLIDRAIRYGEGVAVVLSGLLFGLFHGNFAQGIYAFGLGMFFGFIYIRTGRIRYSIILHMIINFFGSVMASTVLQYFDLNSFLSSKNQYQWVASHFGQVMVYLVYLLLILAIVITGIVFWIISLVKKKFFLNPVEEPIPKKKRFSTVIINTGMILNICFWVGYAVIQFII